MVRGQLVHFLTAEYRLIMWTIVDDSALLKVFEGLANHELGSSVAKT